MRKKALSLGALGAGLLISQLAQANQLTCDKTVNGVTYLEVSSYPTTLHYELTIHNVSTYSSGVLSASDPLLESLGFSFSPAPPFGLDVGASVSDTFDVVLNSAADCLDLAGKDTDGISDQIYNTFTTSWNTGDFTCSATVVCKTPPPPPPPPSGATRTMGFYKTHEQALSQCLAQFPVPLDSFPTPLTLSTALGILWDSPAVYDDTKDKRSEIDRDRVLLGRQLLTAACNVVLFGTPPQPVGILAEGLDAFLHGTDCGLMLDIANQLDEFNNSGDEVPFPAGFDPGPSTPQDAQSKAVDPIVPSGDQCG